MPSADAAHQPMSNQLADHVALVTGGAGGLGSRAATWLAEAGAHVVIADINAEAAAAVANALTSDGLMASSAALDVTATEAVSHVVADIEAEHGRLDILLTSHGFPVDARLLDMTDDAWDTVLNVCLTGTFVSIRAAARAMVKRNYGRIITVSSRAWHGNPGQANYSAAKAGVVGLTRTAAKELGRYSITANSIAPGLIGTPTIRALTTFDQIAERAVKANSIQRLGEPDDVANAVVFLASPQSGFITGEVLHVAGGRLS